MVLLGRISAVLTANTTDFTRQIATAGQELQNFARHARGLQFNMDNRALNQTLTNLQRFQRSLREIQQLQAQGVDAGLPDARRLRDQFRVFEDIGRPLTAVKNQIEALGTAAQAGLYPALERIQSGFQEVYRNIAAGTTTFDAATARIEAMRTSLTNLGQATAAMRQFSTLSQDLDMANTGAEFFQPAAIDSLREAVRLRREMTSLSSASRGGGVFADLASQSSENAREIEAAAATVARAELRIRDAGASATPNMYTFRAMAQERLDSLVNRQNGINYESARQLRGDEIGNIARSSQTSGIDRLVDRLRQAVGAARELNSTGLERFVQNAAAAVAAANELRMTIGNAAREVDRLSAASSAVSQTGSSLSAVNSMLYSQRDRATRDIQEAYDRSVGGLAANDPMRQQAYIQRALSLHSAAMQYTTAPRGAELMESARGLGNEQAIASAERLRGIHREIAIEIERGNTSNLAQNYNQARASLERVVALLERAGMLEQELTRDVEVQNAARRQTEMFLRASGGAAEHLSEGSRDAAADITVARQVRGQTNNPMSRIAIQAEIDATTNRIRALHLELAGLQNAGLPAEQLAAAFARVDGEISQSTAHLAQFISELPGVTMTAAQIRSAMERARVNAGAFGTAGSASAQLAMQQGLFAIDDFMSSTGGLEYKLRAVGNNITQLGLMLGQSGMIPWLTATTGLMIGLGAVLTAHLAIALVKFIGLEDQTKNKTEVLNDALKKQAGIVADLAKEFRSLGDAISSSAAAPFMKSSVERIAKANEIRNKRQEYYQSRAEMLDPEMQKTRAEIKRLEKRREESTTGAAAETITLQIEEQKAKERRRAREVRARSAAGISTEEMIGTAEAARRAVANADAERAARGVGAAGGGPAAIEAARRAALEAASQEADRRNREARQRIDAAGAAGSVARQRQALDEMKKERDRLKTESQPLLFGARDDARDRQIQSLSDAIDRGEAALSRSLDNLVISISQQADYMSNEIGAKLAALEQAIGASVAETLKVPYELQAFSDQIRDAQQALADARDANDTGEMEARKQEIEALEEARRKYTSISETVTSFGRAIEMVSTKLLESVKSESRSAADAARREENAAQAGVADNRSPQKTLDAAMERRRRLEDDARAAEDESRTARQATDNAIRDAERRARDGQLGAEAQQAIKDRDAAQAEIDKARAENKPVSADAVNRRDDAQARLDRAIENDPEVVAARDAADVVDIAAQRRRQLDESIQRGRDVGQTSAEKAGKELGADLRALQDAFDADARVGNADPARLAQDNSRVIRDAMESVAPGIVGLADGVANAVIGGPSRAAIRAADVTTTEGQTELHRLMRGDDASKNQDFVELQKQSRALEELVRIAKDNGAPPGVLDF